MPLLHAVLKARGIASTKLLSSSAHVLCSPARSVTSSSTWCRAAQPAASLRNVPRGSAVLHNFSVRASAAVLSEAAGSANCHALAPSEGRAVIARASWAHVSKHAMYCCGAPVSWGQRLRIWSAVQVSANQVTIHPPMPVLRSSAMASAAA